jgi:Flp pilus assembly protein TadG
MKDSRPMIVKLYNRRGHLGETGHAFVEMAIILPLMLIIVFAIIDFGMLVRARLVITSLSREGGSLASRDIDPNSATSASAADIVTMLQTGASPLDLANSGKIYITRIRAGTTQNNPKPYIDNSASANGGALVVLSSIGPQVQYLGLSNTLYNHLVFNNTNNTADISDVTVVEVIYKYTPISP